MVHKFAARLGTCRCERFLGGEGVIVDINNAKIELLARAVLIDCDHTKKVRFEGFPDTAPRRI